MQAKKHLGQNFLTSLLAVNTLVKTGHLTTEDVVIEIGPGKGALTEKILEHAGTVVAVEKDPDLREYLEQKFSHDIESQKLILIEGDILEKQGEIEEILQKHQQSTYKVVANIPYYITGAILRHFLSTPHQPTEMVLLMQKEVAERIVTRDDKESILSLAVKAYGTANFVKKVSRTAFKPQPKVDSAILHITDITKNRFSSAQAEQHFFTIVKQGFAHKRKTLRKNLNEHYATRAIASAFDRCDININERAEDIPLEKWICLTQHL